jgi:hypothetical protein
MNKQICIIFFLFSSLAYARPFSVEVRDPHLIYLRGPNCESLKSEVDAIQQWTLWRNEIPKALEIDCEMTPDLHEVDITSILPKIVSDNYAVSPLCDGPNCWNWSLVESKLESTLRYVDSEEWKFYLEKYCKIRDVKKNETVMSGDIAAIRSRNQANEVTEIHGFININQMACTKNGYNHLNPYSIVPVEDIFNLYSVDPYQDCRIGLKHPPNHCRTYVNYFQCSKEFGKSLESIKEYRDLIVSLDESQILSEVTALMKMRDFRSLNLVKNKLKELSAFYYISREIGQLRDLIVYSLREQIAFLEE